MKLAYNLEKLNSGKGNMIEHLGIEFLEVRKDYISAKMPVDHRTVQPMGILHGGASVVLAETLGSVGAGNNVDPETQFIVGLEINANHIKSAKSGYVTGVGQPIHIGRSTQIWEIKITNENEQLVCISRITLAVMDKR